MIENNEEKKLDNNHKKIKRTQKSLWVNYTQAHYPLVKECLEKYGFKPTDSESKAHLFWINYAGSIEVTSSLLPWQFYNHFPGTWSLARKVELAKNINNMQKILPNIYNFYPISFMLPYQYNDLKNFMLSISKKSKRTFIIKPDRGSLGKGIILIQDHDIIENYEDLAVAQQYISPYLIDGLKFDLRIYVLITSIEPLRIYIHDEGMARFCTEPYEKPIPSNLEHIFSHLTNYSVNKKNENFQSNQQIFQDDCEIETGHKRSLHSIYDLMSKKGINIQKIKHSIDEIIRLTIASVQPFISNQYRVGITSNDGRSRCFEILGFDILIDKDAKPWLLEVNCKPSMAAESDFDKQIKTSVLMGALKILKFQTNFKKIIKQRLTALSQKRINNIKSQNPLPSLYDFNEEYNLSLETNWRQIYPLQKDDNSNIEQALKISKQNLPGKIIKKKINNNLNENNKNKLIINKSNKLILPLKNLNINKNLNLKTLNKDNLINEILSSKKSSESILPFSKSLNSRLSNRIKSKPLLNQENENIPLFIQFRYLGSYLINEEEERERIRILRKQQQTTQLLKINYKIKQMISTLNNQNKKIDNNSKILINNTKPIIQNSKFFKNLTKPLIISKQFNISEM